MRPWHVIIVRSAALLACAGLPACDERKSAVMAVVLDSDTPIRGRYEAVSVATLSLPGHPDRKVTRDDELCIDERGSAAAALNKEFADLCTSGAIALRGGEISGQMSCKVPDFHSERVLIAFSGSYEREGFDLISSFSVADSSVGHIQVQQIRPYRRTGDC